MSNTKDTPMDYKQFEGHYDDALEKYLNEGINYGANTIARADVEDLKQLASDSFHAGYLVSKLELQKQKELCKTAIALLDNIMSDMKEEGGNQWYTDQIEELIKQSEPLIYKPDQV